MIPVKGSSFGRAGGRRRYPGGTEKRQHLGYRPRVNPKMSRRFPLAHTFNLNRKTNSSVQLHALHPPPLPLSDKGHLLPDFYSGATGLPGRFSSEGFLLRRLHLAATALWWRWRAPAGRRVADYLAWPRRTA